MPESLIQQPNAPQTDASQHQQQEMSGEEAKKEMSDLQTQISQLQSSIECLNTNVFRERKNLTRPPSEYLELFKILTEKLHSYQMRLSSLNSQYPELMNDYGRKRPVAASTIEGNLSPKSPTPSERTIQQPSSGNYSTPNSPSISHVQSSNSNSSQLNTTTTSNNSIGSMQPVPKITLSEQNESLIRVYIFNSTTMIKRIEHQTLKDAVANKLKFRNIDINKCIPYIKENNMKIEWDSLVKKIESYDIVVAEMSNELLHNFEKRTVLFRVCNSCKKTNILHAYTCTECKYTMCSRSDCRNKSELYVCGRRLNSLRDNGDTKSINESSKQILPIDLFRSRDRSKSEDAINILKETIITEPPVGSVPERQLTMITLPRKPKNGPRRRDSLTWEIPYAQIKETGPKVGSGSFGTVHQATALYHDKVAIKFLNVQNPSPAQSDAFRNEVAVLKATRHDNVLLFIGCISNPCLAIVTEWCEGSSLYKHIHVAEEHWNMYTLIDIAKQTSVGMEYLHAKRILHRDLKSNNIFLVPYEKHSHPPNNSIKKLQRENSIDERDKQVDRWKVKIGDFGLATVKGKGTESKNPTGSILWMAPEVIRQKTDKPFSTQADVYSFGVVLYELVTGSLPYAQKEQDMILFLVGMGRLRPNTEDARHDTPQEVKDLLKNCCEFDPDKRPSFVNIHEFFLSLKVARTTVKRSNSAPALTTRYQKTIMSYSDEDNYPTTPLLENNFYNINFTTNL